MLCSTLGWVVVSTYTPPTPLPLLRPCVLFHPQAGRPKRLSVDEAKVLEGQWQDFGETGHSRGTKRGYTHVEGLGVRVN